MMNWKLKDINDTKVKQYTNKLRISEFLARILINRNIDLKMANTLLTNSYEIVREPLNLININEACTMIFTAIVEEDRNVEIFADYDCDGLTAGYIAKTFFTAMADGDDNRVSVYYPERIEKYGLNMDYCQGLVKKYEGKRKPIVITVDNGITKKDEVMFLQNSGFPVLVTDHHIVQDALKPNCLIVDPYCDKNKIGVNLCGAAVIWNICRFIEVKYELDHSFTNYLLYAAAISTISDVMPLDIYNIALVMTGLSIMNSEQCANNIAVFKKEFCKESLSGTTLGWTLAPMLNACGRMGDANMAANFFFEDNEKELQYLLYEIAHQNDERKIIEKKAKESIDRIMPNKKEVFVCIADEYPIGIHGLLASKMMNEYGVPTFVLKTVDDVCSGSCRSNTVPLQLLIAQMDPKLIVSFGGHNFAGGISINKSNIESFVKEADKILKKMRKDPQYASYFAEPSITIDGILTLDKVNTTLRHELELFPYDKNKFKSPVWLFENLSIVGIKHSSKNHENIRFTLEDRTGRHDVWGWGLSSLYEELGEPENIDIVGELVDDFMKPRRTTVRIIDIKAS